MRELVRRLLLAASAVPLMGAAQATGIVPDVSIADVAASCGGAVRHDEFVTLPRADQRTKLRCLLREASKRLNTKLPTRVEYTTLFERTNVAGTTMIYHFRADVSLKEIKPGAMEAWKPTVRAKICATASMREIVSLGAAYRYVWLDHDGKFIDTLTVRSCPT